MAFVSFAKTIASFNPRQFSVCRSFKFYAGPLSEVVKNIRYQILYINGKLIKNGIFIYPLKR